MNDLTQSLLLVLLFTLIGGFFAASETALVSLRESQVQRLAQESKRGERLRDLVANPARYLAAVQVGVTLAGFISAGFGAAEIAPLVAPKVAAWGIPASAAEPLAFVGVTVFIAYLSLVLGELVPKRLAIQHAEKISLTVASFVDLMAKIFRPFIWLLSASSDLLLRLVGVDPSAGREAITGAELRDLVASHEELTDEERNLIDEVFSAGDRELREIMIPRTEVEFLDGNMPVFKAARLVADQPHSRYPVIRDRPDDILGFVHVRDILDPDLRDRSIRLEDIVREVMFFPGSKHVLSALAEMRREGHHLAIVADEYGGTDGIVTMEDLVEELVGDIHDEYDLIVKEERGASDIFEVDGLLNIEDFAEETGIELPEGPYETVAGYVMHRLGTMPSLGSQVDAGDRLLTVTAMDGRRASRIKVSPKRESAGPESAGPESAGPESAGPEADAQHDSDSPSAG